MAWRAVADTPSAAGAGTPASAGAGAAANVPSVAAAMAAAAASAAARRARPVAFHVLENEPTPRDGTASFGSSPSEVCPWTAPAQVTVGPDDGDADSDADADASRPHGGHRRPTTYHRPLPSLSQPEVTVGSEELSGLPCSSYTKRWYRPRSDDRQRGANGRGGAFFSALTGLPSQRHSNKAGQAGSTGWPLSPQGDRDMPEDIRLRQCHGVCPD
jgi:hypothetical protein